MPQSLMQEPISAGEEARASRPESPGASSPRASHAAILTAAQLSRGLSRVCFVLIAARLLGPWQFGVYALLLAWVEMLAVASGSGYADYLTREAARDARAEWGLATQLIALRLACVTPLAAVGMAALWGLKYPRLVLVAAAWLAFSLVPRALSEAIKGVLRGVGRYLPYLVVEFAFDWGLLGAAVALWAKGGSLAAVVAAEVLAAATEALAGMFFARRFRTSQRFYLSRGELLKKSAIFNIYTFVGNLYDRFDIVMLSKLAGDYATGVYSVAYRPLGTIQLLPYGVLYSLLPALSRNPGGPDELRRLERAMGLLLSSAYATVLATMAFAVPAVHLLLGTRFAQAAVALKILIWAVILRFVNYGLNVRLLAGGHERVFVATALGCLGANLVGNLLLIPLYSWRAAAGLTIATEAALFIQNLYWLRRTTGCIPRPLHWVQTTAAFAILLSVSLAAARVLPPLAVGSASLLGFLLYLLCQGMVGEFAAVWSATRHPALGTSPL